MLLDTIIQDCGLTITHYESVQGGDINQAFRLQGNNNQYFLKVNDSARYPAMFGKEMRGLDSLGAVTLLKVPKTIKCGQINSRQYLLMEWLERGIPQSNFWENFGSALALLHQQSQAMFGFNMDNYIGSLVQLNTLQESWPQFYSENRIRPLVKQLYDSGVLSRQDIIYTESYCKKAEDYFPPEPPALLHGDLWSGNCMVAENGYAALFDPAVYFGHREMDLGMTKLFGGFPQQFYETYHEVYPLHKNWQERLPITQLYPMLVHAILFGGNYIERARETIRKFSR